MEQSAAVITRRGMVLQQQTNLGPWNDFDWGMLNGKFSALRWVLGDKWDMLDTKAMRSHCKTRAKGCNGTNDC